MNSPRHCPQCQQPLRPDASDDLCPECLMKVGLGSVPEPAGTMQIGDADLRVRELPKPGTFFGGYRIVRELGRGGMGAVYEAEHLESTRRVALKVLGHQLDSMADRARFLREGRMAGSINHPNSVYVFGTEEIEDTPVIAMELVSGGTLQERVQRGGPFPVSEAVDAILQIIAGLEAAQAIGILHRDIKPANCFQDADGTVKVGDFGLSISTAARGDTSLTMHGQFLGTPAFCSPEQLRGEELNVRSDMYSVGVTLFFLLTGRTPFEGRNMVQLLANVIEKPAPSPKKLRPEIPQGLANAVLRCLEKQPGERFKSYDEFRQALAPFGSDAPVPAPLALRFAAGAADVMLAGGTGMVVGFSLLGNIVALTDPASYQSSKMLAAIAASFAAWVLYYTLLEGWRGASLGKMLFRLRVTGRDRNAPGLGRACARALIYLLPPAVPYWIGFSINPLGFAGLASNWARFGGNFSYYILLALLFSTARRRNGLAALQDLLTGTRVVRKPMHQARPVLAASEETPPITEDRPKVGPFHVIESLEKTSEGEWLLGYDTRLLRKVWIHVVPPGTPPHPSLLRSLGRVGRLRWISGRRSPEENWDVFEGATGAALLKLVAQPKSWAQVRFWLFDLATEISAAEKDGTLPASLSLDRVWITADGRAKLLDFPAPGLAGSAPVGPPPFTFLTPARFLDEVAGLALGRNSGAGTVNAPAPVQAQPPPLHAQVFLEQLRALPGAESATTLLKPMLQRVTVVSRLRRAGLVAGCLAFPLLGAIFGTFGIHIYLNWQKSQPDISALAQVLNARSGLRMAEGWTKSTNFVDDRSFGIYIASHFRETILNQTQWTTLYAISGIAGDNRRFAEQSLTAHPNPTAQEIRTANKQVGPLALSNKDVAVVMSSSVFPLLIFLICLVFYVCLPALLGALIFRGGLLLFSYGLVVARRDGRRASRLRIFWRCLIAWAPVLLAPIVLALLLPLGGVAWSGVVMGALIIGLGAWSLLLPNRGLPDRLAGTCLVPR